MVEFVTNLMIHTLEDVVPNKVKHMDVKVFNLISVVNETRVLVRHQSRESKFSLNKSVCNSKEKWNQDECLCECKELDY